jgi:glucosamine-6-phosphate deaminase
MDRKDEIRELLRMTPDDVVARAGDRLVVCADLDALHEHFARAVAAEIAENHAAGRLTRLIMPVGPTGQYPLLAEMVNCGACPLDNVWFFMMDEYCDEAGHAVTAQHPLSFKRELQRLFLDRLKPGKGSAPGRIVVPEEGNLEKLAGLIEDVGGLDTCYGGIGIHGHVAFNEPAAGVRESGPRLVELNDFTVTINAVRAHVGGNLECFPRRAFTLGMREVLGARRIRLYCRNGCEFDWANTVLRLALFGEPGDDYPVTWIRDRDYVIVTDRDTLHTPANHI